MAPRENAPAGNGPDVGGDAVVVAYGQTDVGRRRERNEDSFLMNPDLNLYVVADGMGGHVGGGFASRMAVMTIEEIVKHLTVDPDVTLDEGWQFHPGDYKGMMRYAIQTASHRIYAKACHDPSLKGMGTTAVALLVRERAVYLANVGDSRGYLVRGGQIQQVTIDHSLVGEQMRAGVLSEADAKSHRLKNIITRSVGFQDMVEIDIEHRPFKPGDVYVLCTDGLTNMVDDQELFSVITHNAPREACQQLVDLANERGGGDNNTVLLVTVPEAPVIGKTGQADEADEPTVEI